jgi:UDP-N-acetylglucosamine diphosphorylase/glucosamine-1-phosphate N-acetyltransferase
MKGQLLFRGRTLEFWINVIFNNVFETIEKIGGLFIVFDPVKLLKIPEEGIDGILSNLNPEEEVIYTLNGIPFYIFPEEIYEKYSKLNIFKKGFEENDLEKIEIMDIQSNYRVYTEKYDPLEIEKTIIEFQIRKLRESGVVIEDFFNFFIEGIPDISEGSKISSGVIIKGKTSIGKNVNIFPNCFIENSVIGNNCDILPGSIIRDSVIEGDNKIGPYSHLRFNSVVKKDANIGNFVEMKKSSFGNGSKAMHLSYIGDATVGKNVNIGAGTITCNYDGEKKNPTVIEDEAFIGSGTELIAPVNIGENSYIAAGSTINEDVPKGSLGIARQKQRIINGWSKRKRKKK